MLEATPKCQKSPSTGEVYLTNVMGCFLILVVIAAFLHHLFPHLTGVPVNVTLSIVREQGSSGEVEIHYQTRPALYKPPSNQASPGQDYISKDNTIIMMNGATVALVTVTILPVRRRC